MTKKVMVMCVPRFIPKSGLGAGGIERWRKESREVKVTTAR